MSSWGSWTGAFAGHNDLKSNFRSEYGWYDPFNLMATPADTSGHGTLMAGIVAGTGVAPSAALIACKYCHPTAGCTLSAALACSQFFMCPTNLVGANKVCTKAPQGVNNSWIGGRNETSFQATINAWQAAGIIPIFAMGNAEPACSSGNSPADLGGLIGVGSTTISDTLASSSGKGPTLNELVKSDISAPGADMRSTWITGASNYPVASGTSMAAPHVSGMVVLMLSARPSLMYDEVVSALYSSADQSSLEQTGYTCGGTLDSVFPNNQYDHGRVNAFAAVNRVLGRLQL